MDMKKKIVACLLCMAMTVSTVPMPMVQAAETVVYDETTGETAVDEDGDTEAKDYIYTAITEGLKASADCGTGTGKPDSVLNDNQDDYWHSAWSGDDQPVRQGGEVVMNSKNNITLTLSEASAVKKLEYVSGGESSNGTITKCNIYYKTSDENAEFQKAQEEPYTLNFTDARATIEFAEPLNDVKEIKIEVLNTAGDETNTFISGKELYIYSADNTKVDSSKITAKAECSSQQGQEVKYFVDDDESTKYHSSWTWQGNYSTEEGFTEIVRPGTTTMPTELVSKNNLYINLTESKTVGKLTYLPRQGEESGTENGRITTANIYVSNSDAENVSEITDWKLVTTANWENSTDEKEVTFSPEMAKHIRIEVKHSAGSTADKYINAAKIGVYEATEEAEHQWGNWEISKKPSKTAKGEIKRTCQNNLERTETLELPVLNETDYGYEVKTEAGCDTEGVDVYTYTKDGQKIEIKVKTSKKGHNWGEWEVSQTPSETAKGEIKRTCQNDPENHTETAELPVLDKTNYEYKVETEAGCDTEGVDVYTYTKDGQKIEIKVKTSKKGHNWGEWEVSQTPSETAKGEIKRTCQNDPENHTETAELPVLDKTNYEYKVETEAGCDTEGVDVYTYTTEDGQEIKIEVKTKTLGHKLTKTAAKAATCTAAGNSEYYTCSDCKKYFSDVAGKNEIAKDSWVIKAKGHTITKKETPATADKEGKIEYSCDVCKDYVEKTFVLPKTETSVYMGKTANLISDASKCSITLANAKKYKKYFTLDTKTGKIKTSTKKLSKVKIKKTIPVKVTVDGKAYNVNVKLKIAAPKIKIKRKKIVIGGVSGYRYELQYNIKGATRVKIRVKKMSVLNKKFDANMSKPKSSKSRCYINASSSGLKKLGNKLTFEIVAYYGKNVSQKFIKRI